MSFLSLPCANAYFLNSNHESSPDNHPSLCCNLGTLLNILLDASDRVVITTILPSAPHLNVFLSSSHMLFSFSSSSTQTSSSTTKNFFPPNLL
ncbi:hypothetical protein HanRHA438_Chr01g0044811 [Helianthus annuus]|nr:hypothetical protein HanRHA438_Chr01g0044811 [Helianthus annuus]